MGARAADVKGTTRAGGGHPFRGTTSRYGRTAVDAELSRLLRADEGGRNDALFTVAVRLFELVKGGEADGQSVTDGLRRATAGWIGVPANDPFTEEERERTLQSAWRTAEGKPAPKVERVNARAIDPNVQGYDRLDLAALRKLPPPTWLVEDVLPEGLSILLGRYGSLKSWVALDWAAHIAAVDGKRVLYFVGEDLSGFGSRVVDLADAHGLDLSNLEVVPDTPKFLRPGELDRLHKTVGEREAALIVIDTWATAIPGVGENDFPELSTVNDMIRRIEKDHGCSTLLVAHTGYADARMRGHTSIEDNSEAIWHAKKDESIPGAAQVTNKKQKRAPLSSPFDVSIRKVDGRALLYPSLFDDS